MKQKPRLASWNLNTISLCLGAGIALSQSAQAASQYFDTTNGNNLTAGTATWDAGTTAAWAGSATPGVLAPVVWVNGSDAFFQTGNNNTANVSGTVQVGNITITASGNSQITTIAGSGTLELAGGITTSGGNQTNVISTSTLTLTGATSHAVSLGRPLTLSSNIGQSGGASSLDFSGNNAVTLSGTNTYSGGTTWAQNTLTVSNAAATNVLQGLGTGTLNLNGGQLNLRANGTGSNQQIITGNGVTGNNVVIGGNTVINSDRVSANGTNTFVFNNLSIGANTLTTSSSNNYDLRFAGTTSLTGSATFDVQSGRNLTLAAVDDAAGTFSVTKNGSGALLLTGANTFDGGISLNAGSLLIGNAGALGTGNLTIAAGTTINTTGGAQTLSTNNTQTWNGNFSFSSSNNLTFGTGAIIMGAAVTELRLTTGNSNTLTYNGAIGETNAGTGFTKFAGSGTVSLNGNNTFTGAATAMAGTLTFGGTNAYSGATTSQNASITVNGTSGSINNSFSYTQANGTLLLDNTAGNTDRLKDASAITLQNGGVLSLTGNSTTNTTETVGGITIDRGSNTLTVASAASRVTTLAAASLSRTNNATGLVRGSSLNQSVGTNVSRITLADGGASLGLVGTSTLNNAASSDATKDLKIVPWLIGDTAVGNSGSNFVTYDTTLGLRVLTATEQTTLAAGYTTVANHENVNAGLNVTLTNASGVAVNSLLFNSGNTNTLNSTNANALTVDSGAVALVVNNTATIGSGFSSLILGNEGVFHVTQNVLNVNTAIDVTSNGGITKSGGGTLTLGNASNTYTGQTTINQGTLSFGTGINNALNGTTGTALQVNGGTFNLNGTTQAVTTVGIGGGGTVSGTGSTLNLGGNVTYDGTANASTGGTISAANINLNGNRTFNVGDSTNVTNDLNVSGLIANGSGSRAIEKTGAGTLVLGGLNTFSGGYTATAGTTILNSASTGTGPGGATASAIGTGVLTLNGGTVFGNGKTVYNNMAANSNTSSTWDLGGGTNSNTNINGNLTSSVAGGGTASGGTVTFTNTGTNNASYSIGNNNAVDWSGFSGVLNYNVTSGIAANIIVTQTSGVGLDLSNATINMTNTGGGTNSAFYIGTTGLGAQITKMGALTGDSNSRIQSNNASARLQVGALNTSTTFAGILQNGSGVVNIEKVGTGTLTLSGTNTSVGSTLVSAGTLQIAKTASLYNSGTANWTAANITVESGATLGVNVGGTGEFTSGNVDTLKQIGTATTGFKNGSILGIDTTNAGGSFAYNTVIANTNAGANSIGLTKLGTGTLTTTGAHTYTGTTTVAAGSLALSGTGSFSNSAFIDVRSGAELDVSALTGSNLAVGAVTTQTLGGAGTITGNAIISSGSTLAAGNGPGTLTVNGATTFNNGSIFSWDISSDGASYDKLDTTSLVDGDAVGGSIFQIVLADTSFTDNFWDNTQTWTNIFSTDGTTLNAIADWADIFSTVTVVNSAFGPATPVDGSFSISGSTLTWSAVPEPTSALAGLLLGAGLLRRRRKI